MTGKEIVAESARRAEAECVKKGDWPPSSAVCLKHIEQEFDYVAGLIDALQEMSDLVESLWPRIPWGKTFGLDIRKLNEAPIRARNALAAIPKEQGSNES